MKPCLLVLIVATGCTGSRWARDDPDYAAKYPVHTDSIPRMFKQAVDARHVNDKGGIYAGIGGSDEPFGMGAEFGLFHYQTPSVETRFGLSGLIYESDKPISGGFLAGVRLQSPSRLAPFLGISGYAGLTPPENAENDGIDNDSDGFIDDPGETDNDIVAAVAPEVGCHFWLNPAWRLTTSANYFFTTSGRSNDFLMINFSLAHLSDMYKMTSRRAKIKHAQQLGWEVGDGPGIAQPIHYESPAVEKETTWELSQGLRRLPSEDPGSDMSEACSPTINSAYSNLPDLNESSR